MTELGCNAVLGLGSGFLGPKRRAGGRFGRWGAAERFVAAWRTSVEHPGEVKAGSAEIRPLAFGRECWHGTFAGWLAGATEGVEEGLGRRIAEELGSFRHLPLSLLAPHCHTSIEKS